MLYSIAEVDVALGPFDVATNVRISQYLSILPNSQNANLTPVDVDAMCTLGPATLPRSGRR
jgi:hypothetical protein